MKPIITNNIFYLIIKIMQESNNEIYRKAEEEFFEDLKYYNASP